MSCIASGTWQIFPRWTSLVRHSVGHDTRAVMCKQAYTLWNVSGNNIGEEGCKALGPHLGKLVNMNTLGLGGKSVLGMRVRGAR